MTKASKSKRGNFRPRRCKTGQLMLSWSTFINHNHGTNMGFISFKTFTQHSSFSLYITEIQAPKTHLFQIILVILQNIIFSRARWPWLRGRMGLFLMCFKLKNLFSIFGLYRHQQIYNRRKKNTSLLRQTMSEGLNVWLNVKGRNVLWAGLREMIWGPEKNNKIGWIMENFPCCQICKDLWKVSLKIQKKVEKTD